MSPRLRRRAERGGIMVIVGVLLTAGVLLGMASLSLDVGRILVEKRELQNSADAAAVSLALDCYKTPASCTTTNTTAVGLTNRNASDGASTIESACSKNITGGSLPECTTASGALADCAPLPPYFAAMSGLPYVEVRTRTKAENGSTFTNWLAGAAFGGNSTSGAGACSRAAVGTVSDAVATLPLTFSACDWEHATGGSVGGGGGWYYASPNYAAYPSWGYATSGSPAWPAAAATPPAQNPGGEVILLSQNPPGGATPATGCSSWNGHALPGGFGVLETAGGDPCKIKEYTHHWMHTDTGNSITCDLSLYYGKVINIPIFDCTADYAPGVAPPVGNCDGGNGSNAYYHRAGYAQFYLSGYNINVTSSTANQKKSLVSNNFPCNGSDRCISGWFLNGSLSATAISGPPSGSGNFGLVGAVPAG